MGTGTNSGHTEKIKHLLYDGGDYKLWGTVTKPLSPANSYHLKISSQWLGAKDPEAEQSKFDCMLDRDTINKFKQMFESL
jgi:hypothetical protein